jgi:cyclic-di-GMP-binding protein
MPSLDIVSRVDMQELDNAVNNARKAIAQRFDFKTAKWDLTLDKKEKKILLSADDGMKAEAIRDALRVAVVKRNVDLKSLKFGEKLPGAGGNTKMEIAIREGLEIDLAKKIVKLIKDSKLKVQPSIQGEEVRISGKQIDDLRAVMALLNGAELEAPLQYVNMKS